MRYLGGLRYAPGVGGVIEKGLLEGSVGGLVTKETGGSFVGGFLGAFTGAVMESQLTYGSFGQDVLDVAIASAVGGGISKLAGGSFANAADSTAFQILFNDATEHGIHTHLQKWNKNQVMVTQACARKIFKAILGKSPKTITLQDRAFAQSLADAGINATQHMNFLFNWLGGIARIMLIPGEDLIPEGDLNLVGHLGYDASSQLLREQKSLYQELKHVESNEAVLKTLHHNFGETFLQLYYGNSTNSYIIGGG